MLPVFFFLLLYNAGAQAQAQAGRPWFSIIETEAQAQAGRQAIFPVVFCLCFVL
jgi:hypothetical protein